MKNKSRWLALMLTGSMMISPLSYTRTYAAENEQQYETNLQETVEVEEADPDKKQDESQTEDAGNVKEDQTEESDIQRMAWNVRRNLRLLPIMYRLPRLRKSQIGRASCRERV